MKRNRISRLSAFTLLEIMLVVAIITLLLGAGFYMLGDQFGSAQRARADGDIHTFKSSLRQYEMQNGSLPTTEQGLQALVTLPQTEPRPSRWFQVMSNLPKDPWDHDYIYAYPGKHNPQSFDVVSKGKDGLLDTPDDIGNWKK